MKQSERRLHELIDTDIPDHELERLARADAFLRAAVSLSESPDCVPIRSLISAALQTGEESARPRLRLVMGPATQRSTPRRTGKQTHELKLSFGELALVYKSLQAAKTLGLLPPQDELLNDTIQLVDQAMQDTLR